MADRKRRDSAVESDLLQKRFRADSNSKDDGEGDDDDDDDDDGEEEEEEEDNVTNIYCQLSEYDQAILLHLLTGDEVIYSREIDKGEFHKYLENTRSLCDMDSRPLEEDIRSIKSMTDKGDVLKRDEEKVEFSSPEVRVRIIEDFADSVRTDSEYLILSMIIEKNWYYPKYEGIRKRIIQNILQPFVWRKGLDFIDFFVTKEYLNVTKDWLLHYGRSVITEILKLPAEVWNMCTYQNEKWIGFKGFVQQHMELCQKSISELNLDNLLGSYVIGFGTGNEIDMYGPSPSTQKCNILCHILTSEEYCASLSSSWKDKTRTLGEVFPILQNDSIVDEVDVIKELIETDKVLTYKARNNAVGFVSDDVRHQVMSYFVLNCLNTVDAYENYIRLSSVDSLLEYVRPWWYNRDAYERCMYLPKELKTTHIQRLGLMALRYYPILDYQDLVEKDHDVLEALCLPYDVFNLGYDTTSRLIQFTKTLESQRQAPPGILSHNSALGSFLILENLDKTIDLYGLSLSRQKWSILIHILTSEKYNASLNSSWKDKTRALGEVFPVLQNDSIVDEHDVIKELIENDKVLTYQKNNSSVGFASDDVRHQVMSYFVQNCLNTVEDYENYFRLSSVDSLLEYVRTWLYIRDTDERCMYLTEGLEESFIKGLGIDAIRHIMVEDREDSDSDSDEGENCILDEVKKILNEVPEEIFDWDYEARCRYVECAKRGTQTIHRARLMIVGCAGAGKTTLLRRLQKQGIEELKQVESTVGLEVHEDMFEITDNGCLRALSEDTGKEDKQILSVVDFGGQCAYYACHQVFLSRRAFYLLVLDMSKPFTEKVDESLCEQNGTMFADWTYGGYVMFWLKSIHTYCADDTAIIVVATHSENTDERDKRDFFDRLLDLLPADDAKLKKHFRRNRCFFIGLPIGDTHCLNPLSDLENCIVSIAKEHRWKESIPKEWSMIELVFMKRKEKAKNELDEMDEDVESIQRIISVSELEEKFWLDSENAHMEVQDALRFFNDIGLILYFNEEELSKSLVIDVQWFINSFKFIISDRRHVRDLAETDRDWQYFNRTGYLLNNLLYRIWEAISIDLYDEDLILHYMQRLGLLAIGDDKHYVPSMNKRNFDEEETIALRRMETKSSVLVFHFQFLPFFFYCRLIVACIVGTEWKVVEDDGIPCLYKDVAVFVYKDHLIALVVTMSAIQVQIFRKQNTPIDPDIASNIKTTLENRLGYLTSTFHKKVTYRVAFQCSVQDVLTSDVNCYVYEEEISDGGQIVCPRHALTGNHLLDVEALTRFWKPKPFGFGLVYTTDEEKIQKLVKTGRDALQEYFDTIFPPEDLEKCLQDHKTHLTKGHYKFNDDQIGIVYPPGCSTKVISKSFDVTIMYKLLRNFGDGVSSPTNGWGKEPVVGQKTIGDDIERIRKFRNMIAHGTLTGKCMDGEDFRLYWEELAQAILRLTNGSYKSRIDAIHR
ncbi:uncharacterized protein LOC125652354 isoform X1 [Ostrea edulis]|uniref:uncharacterized protein LOC125652354 isoform X1 n=1 Tax=Ostrea edulis TaxID=37623 RepID=UPI0024AFE5F7|nr:uncharacterized protein LOC125652354 isoform X1 [Ostrea edulis]